MMRNHSESERSTCHGGSYERMTSNAIQTRGREEEKEEMLKRKRITSVRIAISCHTLVQICL